MVLVWLVLLIEILVVALFRSIISDFELISAFIIIINIIFVTIYISRFKKSLLFIIYIGFVMRLFFLFWDVFGRDIFILPGSGGDTEGFYNTGLLISQNINLIDDSIYGGVYSKFLGLLFYLIGPQRIVGQYINVLLGLTIIIIIIKTLKLLEVREKYTILSAALIACFPNAIIFSSILLREAFISCLVLISFYLFVKWYKYNKKVYLNLSIIFLGLASTFHSGVIGMVIGYIFMLLFYRHAIKKLVFNMKTIIYFIIIISIGSLLYYQLGELFLNKFNNISGMTDIYDVTNYSSGGSAYLTEIRINSIWTFILNTPIKMFYFFTSPLPMNWRGLSDVFSFLLDGLVYLLLLIGILLNYKKISKKEAIVVALFIIVLSVSLIFAIGVSNAGTAMRHRHKILPIIIIFYTFLVNYRSNREKQG